MVHAGKKFILQYGRRKFYEGQRGCSCRRVARAITDKYEQASIEKTAEEEQVAGTKEREEVRNA